MKKILITGASGFIGSFLVEEALKRDYQVFAGVRRNSPRTYLSDSRIQFFESELSDKNLLTENLKKHMKSHGRFDYIIHNAGITKSCHKEDFEKVNFEYTKNLIQALIATGGIPDKFIYMSSLAAYGPGDEHMLQPIKDTDTPHPITLYGKSKLKAENYIKSLQNFPYLIFRPTGVYGMRERDYYLAFKNVKNGMESYIGTSEQHLTFIYVKDLTRLILDALTAKITGKSYFVSDLNQYTAKEFHRLIKKSLGKRTISLVVPKPIVKIIFFFNEKLFCLFGNPPLLNTEKYKELVCKNWLCDSSQIVRDFGFVPKYDLKKGVQETLAGYKAEKLL